MNQVKAAEHCTLEDLLEEPSFCRVVLNEQQMDTGFAYRLSDGNIAVSNQNS